MSIEALWKRILFEQFFWIHTELGTWTLLFFLRNSDCYDGSVGTAWDFIDLGLDSHSLTFEWLQYPNHLLSRGTFWILMDNFRFKNHTKTYISLGFDLLGWDLYREENTFRGEIFPHRSSSKWSRWKKVQKINVKKFLYILTFLS